MPMGTLKNTVYSMALPILGQRCLWHAQDPVGRVLHRRHVVGACVQRLEKGALTACYTVGFASLEGQPRPVQKDTVFRTASIAKMVTALLVMRLQTQGRLNVQQDISDLAGSRIRNPYCPEAPITLGMLLSHTAAMADSPAYFASFQEPVDLDALLKDRQAWLPAVPGLFFHYSNLGAGMVACLLEKHFGCSFEQLAQQELFAPLRVRATFDASALPEGAAADCYRVLPKALAYDAKKRREEAVPMREANPQRHYLAAAGGLMITAPQLARLALLAWDGGRGFISEECLALMKQPIGRWPERQIPMGHGMGLLKLEDPRVCSRPVWGHQGFAYGAVNGVFFDREGNGFVQLNSGASEQRKGHLALVNRDLIHLLMKG